MCAELGSVCPTMLFFPALATWGGTANPRSWFPGSPQISYYWKLQGVLLRDYDRFHDLSDFCAVWTFFHKVSSSLNVAPVLWAQQSPVVCDQDLTFVMETQGSVDEKKIHLLFTGISTYFFLVILKEQSEYSDFHGSAGDPGDNLKCRSEPWKLQECWKFQEWGVQKARAMGNSNKRGWWFLYPL